MRHAHVPTPAILLIVGSVLCFTLLDTIIKFATQRYPVPLLVWARYAVQVLAMLVWLGPSMRLRPAAHERQPLQLARGCLLLAVVAVLLQRAQVPAARRSDGDQLLDADDRHRAGASCSSASG